MKQFSVSELIKTAQQRTGLSDFGQPEIFESLEAFVESVNEGADISPTRWGDAREYIIRLLINRLWFAKDLAEHPEILDEQLKPMGLVLALPRTGSTKLQRLLGVGDDFQNLLWWQMHMFARIPDRADGGVAERLQVTKNYEKWSYEICPDMLRGHPRFAEEPEEEQILNEFMFPPLLSVQFSGADYSQERLVNTDIQPVYDYMEMQLKYLQWQFHKDNVKPWLLKSPSNMGYEENLVKTFGRNMKVITTHRDPVNVVCSITRTAEYYRYVYSDNRSKDKAKVFGQNMLNALAYVSQMNMKWRDQNPDIDVLDISFSDINKNTMAVLERSYDFMGIKLTDEVVKKVRSWEENQQKSHLTNQYRPEDYGLTKAQIHLLFEPYMARYSEYI